MDNIGANVPQKLNDVRADSPASATYTMNLSGDLAAQIRKQSFLWLPKDNRV